MWSWAGIVDAILATGRSVVAPDRRGSGQSDRPHHPGAYANNACAHDVSALIDHLGLDRVDLGAYSLGAAIALRVLQTDTRITRAVLGGVGDLTVRVDRNVLEGAASQIEEADVASLPPSAQLIRQRIDRFGADPVALAAMWRGPFAEFDESFRHVRADILIVTGELDTGFGDPVALADRFRQARVVRPPTNHDTTMEHPAFVNGILQHLCPEEVVDTAGSGGSHPL